MPAIRKWRPFKFAIYSTKQNVKVPVLITRQEGDTVYYRQVRSNGRLGIENCVLANSARLNPMKGDLFTLRVEGQLAKNDERTVGWEITIPDLDGAQWHTYRFPLSKTEAVRIARERFGSDTLGRIYIARPVKDGQPRETSNL